MCRGSGSRGVDVCRRSGSREGGRGRKVRGGDGYTVGRVKSGQRTRALEGWDRQKEKATAIVVMNLVKLTQLH